MTRVGATTLRIVWAVYPTSIRVGIAASVFVYAGIFILFLGDLFFAQRIIRAQHPRFGWSKPVSVLFPVVFAITGATILALIVAAIYRFYTLSAFSIHAVDIIQKYGLTWLAFVAFLPIPIVIISCLVRLIPHVRMTKTTDKFGQGSMRMKIAIVLISATFLTLGAGWRAGTALLPDTPTTSGTPPRPVSTPWYFSKACFYIFDFTIEEGICLFWLLVRIDKRFYIPDGASAPFSYAGGFVFAGESGNEKKRLQAVNESQRNLTSQGSIYSSKRGSMRGSHISIETMASTRKSSEQATRVSARTSWGGISQVAPSVAEDGQSRIPYAASTNQPFPEDFEMEDIDIDKEMGWDPKSGKWVLRSVPSLGNVRPTTAVSPLE